MKHNNNFVFTGPLDPKIWPTTAPSITCQFTPNQSDPYLQALSETVPRPSSTLINHQNTVMHIFLPESIYFGSSKGLLLPYYECAIWYQVRTDVLILKLYKYEHALMDTHNLTAITYQKKCSLYGLD